MLSLLLSAVLLFAPQQGGERASGPSAEDVARVTAGLDEAFRANDVKRLQVALEAAQSVPHADVVRKVVHGLEDERADVVLATLQALRWLDHPDALQALHRAAKERKLMRVPEQAAALLRAVAQHADPSSIALLAR